MGSGSALDKRMAPGMVDHLCLKSLRRDCIIIGGVIVSMF